MIWYYCKYQKFNQAISKDKQNLLFKSDTLSGFGVPILNVELNGALGLVEARAPRLVKGFNCFVPG